MAQIDVGVEPEGMAVSHDGRWAVTTSETTNMVHWIDTASHEIAVANTLVGQRPRYARFTADDRLLWVTSEIGGTVAVIDVASQAILHEIRFAIPGVPGGARAAGRPAAVARRQDRLRGAGPGQPGRRGRH